MKRNRSMMKLLCTWVVMLAALSVGCDSVEGRTQLTFEISASASLQQRLTKLRVVVQSNNVGDQIRDFASDELKWPVQIVVIPEKGNQSTDSVTLIATVYDAAGKELAKRTEVGRFEREKARVVDMPLDGVGPDGGPSDGGTRPEPTKDSGSSDPKPDAAPVDPDEPDTGTPDAGPGVVNCETDKTIKCDDGNRCNGTETCSPGDATASNEGCIRGSDVKTCGVNSICDGTTGECSTCLVNGDGDGDNVKSITCGGTDCDDNDKSIAPGKPELCDGKDNDCDKTVDGTAANASCAPLAPSGGTASCGTSGSCVRSCTDPTHVITNNMCMAPVVAGSCPIINPCAPGSCAPANGGGYTCTCPAGFRAGLGMTRCAPVGVATQNIGFESTCSPGVDTPGPYAMGSETKALSPTLYAACGLASISSDSMLVGPELIKPTTTVIEGLSKTTALSSVLSTTAAPSVLIFSFSPAVNEVSFDLLDIDNPAGVSVVATTGATSQPAVAPVPMMGSKRVRVTLTATVPAITRVTVSYTQLNAMDRIYVDELNYRVAGCGDKVVDTMASETCDDGNAVQCDGCDNACALAAPPACTP